MRLFQMNHRYHGDLTVEKELLLWYNTEYFRIPVINQKAIDQLTFSRAMVFDGTVVDVPVPATEEQKQAIKEIYSLYTKNCDIQEKVKGRFVEEMLSRPNLLNVKNWWNGIPVSFSITAVGKVLAHANAKRCDSSFPDLD